MNLKVISVKIVVISLLILSSAESFGQDSIFLRDFSNGSIVEGSMRFGGLQPDYILDTESKEFSEIWEIADQVRNNQELKLIEKVEFIIKSVRDVFSRHHKYNDPVYLNLMKKFREVGQAIPLSQYVSCGVGVCRENALLLHLALKRAGIPNFYVYANVLVDYAGSTPIAEDHGFVVFEYENERWIADSYFKQFNGYSFDEFMQHSNILRIPVRRLSFAETRAEPRAIVELNSYPQAVSCRTLISQ